MAESTSLQIEIDLEELAVPAADLLSDADVSTRVTRPYEVPLEDELFGDLTRTSAQFTLPVALDELPDDAYPTEIYFFSVGEPLGRDELPPTGLHPAKIG